MLFLPDVLFVVNRQAFPIMPAIILNNKNVQYDQVKSVTLNT